MTAQTAFEILTTLCVLGTLWMGWPVMPGPRRKWLFVAAFVAPWVAWVPFLAMRGADDAKGDAVYAAAVAAIERRNALTFWRWAAAHSEYRAERVAAVDMLAYLGHPLANPDAVLVVDYAGPLDMDGRRITSPAAQRQKLAEASKRLDVSTDLMNGEVATITAWDRGVAQLTSVPVPHVAPRPQRFWGD